MQSETTTYSYTQDTSYSTIANDTVISYELTIEAIVLWSLLYIILVVVGLLGNIGICWIIFYRKKMRTVTNYFLSSTAFAAELNQVVHTFQTNATRFCVNYIFTFTVALVQLITLLITEKTNKVQLDYKLYNMMDCFVIAFNTLFNFTYAVNGNHWFFDSIFCRFSNLVPIGAVCASILSITTISIDRFILVVFPMRQRISKKSGIVGKVV